MLDFQSISALVFIGLLFVLFLYYRKQFVVQKIFFPVIYFAMYKTKIGLKAMDRFATFSPRFMKNLGYVGVGIGFLGMGFIAFTLIQNIYNLFTTPTARAGVALVLPVRIKGTFFVPFFYWIISIFILAVVHEFSHGIYSRLHNIRIKSSGFAFLAILIPILPAAFVEPDEKQLVKKSKKVQLSVFAAGPFANIILALVVLLISSLVTAPINDYVIEEQGVEVTGFVGEEFPVAQSGIKEGDVIVAITDTQISTVDDFTEALQLRKPGNQIFLETADNEYMTELVSNPEDEEEPYLGVYVQQKTGLRESFVRKYSSFVGNAIVWLAGLLFWLFVLNLGIGLFNLLPLGPIDGGRMLRTALHHFFDEQKGDRIWKYVSLFFLLLLLFNLVFAFVR